MYWSPYITVKGLVVGNRGEAPHHAVGERIRVLRQARGIESQGALAALVGVARGAVTAWENGKHPPAGPNLLRLAKVLESSVEFIMDGADSGEPTRLSALDYAAPEFERRLRRFGESQPKITTRKEAEAAVLTCYAKFLPGSTPADRAALDEWRESLLADFDV